MCTKLDDTKVRLSMNPDLVFYVSVMCQLDILTGSTPYGTAHTNGKEIVFDPEFVKSLPEPELLGLLLHEIRHVTDMHTLRRGDRNPQQWNKACDHVINLDLLADGFKLPKEGLADRKYTGMSAEEVYEALVEQNDQEPNPMPDLQVNGSESPSEDELKQIEQDVKDILIQAVQLTQRQSSTAAGKIPQHVLRQVDEWINPVLPWYTILQRYLTEKCKDDYSWKRPSRRGLSQGLYMPSLYSEQVGNINIYLDASCSVSDEMFAMQIAQFRYIHRNIMPKELKIVTFNTKIVDEFTFKPNEPVNINYSGRGGTSLREVVPHMLDNPAECHIIFTDAYVNISPMEDARKEEILWVVYDNPSFNTDVGKVLHI